MKRPSTREAGFLIGGLLLGLSTCVVTGGRDDAPAGPAPSATKAAPAVWTCSMHPQIQSPKPGDCPICGMDLIPLEDGGDDRDPRELRLSPAAVALAEIETQPVVRREVSRDVRLVGKVDYDETRLDYITAWVSGRLDRMYVDYTGTLVRDGDHLVEVFSPELLSAQEELLQAIEALAKLRAGSSDLLRETSARTVESSREKLRLLGLAPDQIAAIEARGAPSDHVTIRAPLGGVVVHKNKNTGDYVKTGERIYTIADLSQVWIKLDAYESDLPWVRYGQTVDFETEAYPGVRFSGQVVFIDPVLSGETRTVKVRLNVDNADGRLKPGMFVRGLLRAPLAAEGRTLDPSLAGTWICPMHWDEIEPEPGSCDQCGMPLVPAESLHRSGEARDQPPLVVPASAVLWTGRRSLVYVREPGDEPRFVGQEVVLGPRAGDHYVVREGLDEGQLVVTRGAFKLDSALQIEARPSMMLPPADQRGTERHEVPSAFLHALGPVFQAYLDVGQALAGDDLAAAQAGARAFGAALGELDLELLGGDAHVAGMALTKRLRDASTALAAADALTSARGAFHDLSQAMLDLERGFGHPSGVLRQAHCPMARDDAGADWLQTGDTLRNPYYGASMLTCGEFRADFAPRGAGARAPERLDPPQLDRIDPPQDLERPRPQGSPADATPAPPPNPQATPAPSAEDSRRAFVDSLGTVFSAGLEAWEALASDDVKSAREAGAALSAGVDAVDSRLVVGDARLAWQDEAARLRRAAQALTAADDLQAARTAFHGLSEALIALERRFGHPRGVLRRAHCPMARKGEGADWLQTDEALRNPYFGARMLRCGSFEEDFAPALGSTSPEGGQ